MDKGSTIDSKSRQRHSEVLGHGPRVEPCDRQDVADLVKADTAHLLTGIGSTSRDIPLEMIPEIMFTMCRFPKLWRAVMDVTVPLQGPDANLPPRDRKLAILRTGWLCQAPYEFGEHVAQAHKMGFTEADIERVIEGSQADGWSEHERAILRAVEELRETAMVCDDTWEALAAAYDEAQMVELMVLIGQFTATAYFQNAMRLRLEKGNEGLLAR